MLEKKQTVLITGGTGYIGSVLADQALLKGLKVNVLDQLDNRRFGNSGFKFFRGSITDRKIVEESLKDVNYVIHLAGVSDGRAGKANPVLTKKINVDCLEQLLDSSRNAGVERFIFASTLGVYGNKYSFPLTEDLPLNPIDPYSESKAAGEEIIKGKKSDDSLITSSLRIAMVYGYSPAMRYDFIVNRLALDAVEKKRITITGGKQKRPQVYIKDLSNIFLDFLAVDKNYINRKSFNVVGINPSIEEITDAIRKRLPDTEIKKLPPRENEDSFEMNGDRLKSIIRSVRHKSLDEGIEIIINEYSKAKNRSDELDEKGVNL